MGELRFDQTTANWVIFAPSRSRRPNEFVRGGSEDGAGSATSSSGCPFCPGNEAKTPNELFAIRPEGAGSEQWLVRVVPNKFPALQVEEQPDRRRAGETFVSMGGCGAHEVIIESPHHGVQTSEQPVEQIERIVRTAHLRYQALMQDQRLQTVVIFKNHGEAAGTSLTHPHWQIIATPVAPHALRLRHEEATWYFDRTGECLYCAMVEAERDAAVRMVAENAHFTAFVPYAAHLPFETWILPRVHQASFGLIEEHQFRPLAEILKTVLTKLRLRLGDASFNLTIDTAPRGDERKGYFLWHLRILPRLTTPAGFELGSGMSINPVLPEEAAEFLRNVEPE